VNHHFLVVNKPPTTTGEISVGQIDSLQETQFLDGYQ
jgi:hypothetical protein